MKIIRFLLIVIIFITVTSVKLNAATVTILVGQTYQTEISSTGYHYLSIESVSSTNPSVGVTKMGLVVKATINAYFPGEADIVIKLRYRLYAGQPYQYREQQFSLACNDTSIGITPANASLKIGETLQLSYSFNRPTHISPSIYWSSSDESIATVSNSGLVTAKSTGKVQIYAKSNLGSNSAVCSISVTETGDPGSGTIIPSNGDKSWYSPQSEKFYLSTPEELMGLRDLVAEGNTFNGKTIYLKEDINLQNINWTTPIGLSESKPFSGTFDGKNHNISYKINHSTINNTTYDYYGLFGYSTGYITNLSVSGSIDIKCSSSINYIHIGGIVGKIANGMAITNCCSNVSIKYIGTKTATQFTYIGGISGYNSRGDFNNCVNLGSISDYTNRQGNSSYNNHFVGGICGVADGADIIYCFNEGTVECSPEIAYNYNDNITAIVGGLAGSLTSYGRILYSANVGNTFGTASTVKLGGIAGVIQKDAVIINCYVGCYQLGDGYVLPSLSGNIGSLGGDTNSNAEYIHNYVASDMIINHSMNGRSADKSFSIEEMKSVKFASTLNSYGYDSEYFGAEGLFPLPKINTFMTEYYNTRVIDITCNSATLISNVADILGSNIKSTGFLIKQDDGKEYYRQCESGSYKYALTNLEADRTYSVRWFAINAEDQEVYGAPTIFKTKSLNPITLSAEKIGVSSVLLSGDYYCDGVSKYGFYVHKNGSDESRQYFWTEDHADNNFKVLATNLLGNTIYCYSAVIEINGIYYAGEEKQFTTALLQTLVPSKFTNSSAVLEGEIGINSDNAYFEFRDKSLPSGIDSEILPCSSFGKVSATANNLLLNHIYKYRLIAQINNERYESDWIEFTFEGESGINDIIYVNPSEEAIEIYNLNGVYVSNAVENIKAGVYILRQGSNCKKIIVR